MKTTGLEQLVKELRGGDRRALARAITLVESSRSDHRESADLLLKSIMPYTGAAFRIGISGVPGVGKSTFIEALGNHIIDQGLSLAVLAVDPSSPVTGGSIMGDKTRMEALARRPEAFIRPTPAGATLGGVTRRTREALLLCEAAGFDLILVETVGIGQSEATVAWMTDMFILMLLPGAGDELQGIKRGVTELADLVLINKADGDLAALARHAAADYTNALRFVQPRYSEWPIAVRTCSALERESVAAVWAVIEQFRTAVSSGDALRTRRGEQARSWFWDEVSASLVNRLKHHPVVAARVRDIEKQVVGHEVPPTVAAQELVDLFTSETAQ